MQPNDFQYTLKIDGVETVLTHAPIGWEDQLIKWGRDNFYFGMVRTFSVPLKFTKEGATLLRKEFYTSGIEGNARLTIDKLNPSTWLYEPLYVGDVDFSNFKDGDTDVEANIMEGGISKQIKAYENVKYELDMTEAVDILITGLSLRETGTLLFYPQTDDRKGDYFPAIQIVYNEQKSVIPSLQEVEGLQQTDPDYSTSDKWFFQAQIDGFVKLDGYVKGWVSAINDGKTYKLLIMKSTGVLVGTIVDISPPAMEGVAFDVPFQVDVEMNAGEKLFFYEDNVTGPLIGSSGMSIEEGEIIMSYNTISAPSFCKALRPKYVFEQLIQKMNKTVYPTQSYLLDEWKSLLITSGDAIRQIEGAKVKTSFKEFFNSMNALLNVGFGIANGKAVLEKKSYFFQPSLTTIDLKQEVKDFTLEPHDEVIYNTVKVGYQNQSYDEINGRDEFNSEQRYSTPITRIQKELNLISDYRADSYGIEFLRINLEGKNSTDSASDNDVFFIKVKPAQEIGGHYLPETAESYTSVLGLNSGSTAYNLAISPKQNLLRHGDYLHGMLDRLDGRFINFESAVKNKELVTIKDGVKVAEKSNISISSLPDKLFLPYAVSFTAKIPRNTMQMINNFPTGCIKFTYKQVEYAGFILDVSVDASKNEEQQLKLLLSPQTNLLNLIN